MLTALLAAVPSIYKLFTSDDKDEAVKKITGQVVQSAAAALGIETTRKEDIVKHLEQNPDDVYKLKKLDNDFELRIKELDLKELELNLNHEQKQEENITNRWTSDNDKGSKFAKLLRPGLTAFLVFMVTVLALLDGNVGEFAIKTHWATLFTSLTLTSVGGYFTLRTYEKRTNTSKWNSNKNKGDR
jgi:hypothetical protein